MYSNRPFGLASCDHIRNWLFYAFYTGDARSKDLQTNIINVKYAKDKFQSNFYVLICCDLNIIIFPIISQIRHFSKSN